MQGRLDTDLRVWPRPAGSCTAVRTARVSRLFPAKSPDDRTRTDIDFDFFERAGRRELAEERLCLRGPRGPAAAAHADRT